MKRIFKAAAVALPLLASSVPAVAQSGYIDSEMTNRVYYNLQEYAGSSRYKDLVRRLRKDGIGKHPILTNVRTLLKAIESSRFDRDLQAKAEFSSCAARSMLVLADAIKLVPTSQFRNKAEASGTIMYLATGGDSAKLNCYRALSRYGIRLK